MDYTDFCNWLKEQNIQLNYTTIGDSGVNGVMQFSKNGYWFLNVRKDTNTDYFEVKEAILAELNGKYPESIHDIVTVSEVAEKLGKDTSTIRKAIEKALVEGKIIEGKDCRKAVQTWLIKKVAVKKIYKEFEI